MSFTVPTVAPEPSTYQPTSTVGALLCDAMAPWLTEPLAWLLDAFGVMLDPVYLLVQDTGYDDGSTPTIGTYDADGSLVTDGYRPGYGVLLDPTSCPAASLPYLGQFVGVQVPAGADEATARSLVSAEAGLNRGTPRAVVAAAKRNLTGTQSVELIERKRADGSASGYSFGLIVSPSESGLAAGTYTQRDTQYPLVTAVAAVKPAGVMFWVDVTDATVWNSETSTWAADTHTWDQKG